MAVATLVTSQNEEILLVESFRRGWEFPGGYVSRGESLQAAASREVKEESGIEISHLKMLGFEHNIKQSTTIVIFSGIAIGGKLTVSNENRDVGYFNFDEALAIMKLQKYKERLSRCFNEAEIPFFIEK